VKRVFWTIVLTAVTALLVIALPGMSGAAPGSDVNGPACVNINGWTPSYAGGGAARDQPTYTLYIVTDTGADPVAIPGTIDSTGGLFFGPVTVTDDDPDICVYATSSRGSRILDTAPDTGCLSLTAGGTGGGSGFN
jgi:hypothetical protein